MKVDGNQMAHPPEGHKCTLRSTLGGEQQGSSLMKAGNFRTIHSETAHTQPRARRPGGRTHSPAKRSVARRSVLRPPLSACQLLLVWGRKGETARRKPETSY